MITSTVVMMAMMSLPDPLVNDTATDLRLRPLAPRCPPGRDSGSGRSCRPGEGGGEMDGSLGRVSRRGKQVAAVKRESWLCLWWWC
jgi:hypothetical protein